MPHLGFLIWGGIVEIVEVICSMCVLNFIIGSFPLWFKVSYVKDTGHTSS